MCPGRECVLSSSGKLDVDDALSENVSSKCVSSSLF